MAQFIPLENRPLAKKLYIRTARFNMLQQGFGHDWIETYLRRLADEIDAATTKQELEEIRERVVALRKSPPPIAWIGA